MESIRKILCIIDPTVETHPVVERATWLAEQTGAAIELRICIYKQLLGGGWLFGSRLLRKARGEVVEAQQNVLNEIAKDLIGNGLDVTASVVWDHPLHDAIARSAIETEADLVMKDTHPHSVMDVSTLSNTDWNLIRTCPAPLWLVKPNISMSSLKIIAAVDPTHENDKPADLDSRIIGFGAALANEPDAELHICHAVQTEPTVARTSPHDIEPTFTLDAGVLERLRGYHRNTFDELAKKHGISEERAHFVEGSVHDVLPKVAAEVDARLVVMGAVARGRLQRIFIGSSAERVLDRMPGDLLILKPRGFETPVSLDDRPET